MVGPLDGIKVLDFTWALAGPYATMILKDLGAAVIKVEILTGDRARMQGPIVNNQSTYFFSINRGKKSVAIDLKTKRGKDIALEMAKKVDVIVENFTPGTMDKLGLGYEVLKRNNPRIIYAALSGFGQTGPYRQKPALDIVVQAMGGLMSMTGPEDGGPARVGASVGDITGGLFLTIGILSALCESKNSGLGQMLDISMLDCQAAILENAYARYFATGQVPKRMGTKHQVAAIHQAFPTRDNYIAFTVGGLEQWTVFLDIIGRLDVLSEEKYHNRHSRAQNMKTLEPIVIKALSTGTTAEWIERFEAVGIPCAPINNIAQGAENPQLLHRNMFIDLPFTGTEKGSLKVCNTPIRLSRTSPQVTQGAPEVGQHTEEILSSLLDMSEEEINSLKQEGVIVPEKLLY